MGGAQAAGVLATVKRAAIEKVGRAAGAADEEAAFKTPDAGDVCRAVAPALRLGKALGRR
jgi:hypothetical protein